MTYALTAPMKFAVCAVVTCALSPACKTQAPSLEIAGDAHFDGRRVSLVGVRGEVLGWRVAHRDAGSVRLELPGVHAHAFSVERVVAKRASSALYGGGRGAGAYPDVLVAATAPTTNPAYFEIEVAGPAGTRAGLLHVGAREIPVELVVVDVQLPATPPRVWAYYDPRELAWANLGNGTIEAPSAHEARCIEMFRRYGVALSPDLTLAAWPARKALLGDFPFVPVRLTKDPDKAGEEVRGWIGATYGSGKLPFAIPIDEPRKPEARGKVRALAAATRAAGGGPNTFMYAVTDEPRVDYLGLVDLYITLRPRLADQFPRWTYNGAPPRAGSFVLDAEPPGPRTWGWLAHRWQIPVWYIWDALYWHDRHNRKGAPLPGRALDLADPISFNDGSDHGNLDGILALPGDEATPCRPTLRLAAIRRGMQDRALIEAAAACDRAATTRLVEKMVPRGLGDAARDEAPAWPRDEAAWESARRELVQLAKTCR